MNSLFSKLFWGTKPQPHTMDDHSKTSDGQAGSNTVETDAEKSAQSSITQNQNMPSDRILLQALLDNLTDAVYFKDIKSRFILVNKIHANGYSALGNPDRAIGRTDFDIFSQKHAKKAYEDEQTIIHTGEPLCDIEEKESWPDGHVAWVRTSKFPLRNDQGIIIGTWGISRDITNQKKAEEDLTSTEEKLRHAQKMEAFGQLSGGIAHDFNNMLSIILGSSQLIDMKVGTTNPEIKHHINTLIDTTVRAADLTQKLLTFARKGTYKVVPIEINDVVHSVIGLLKHTLDKNIRIVECLNATYSKVQGDYVQLQNALLNLAINSRDAMPNGGVLTFSTEEILPGEHLPGSEHTVGFGRYLRISVTDTGTGMDEQTKLRAFEPFFTTKEVGKGTGLGLSSVYGTVKSHNGLVELQSELKKGTTIKIFLPLIHKIEEPTTTETCKVKTGSGTILVVDDEEDIRVVVSDFLGFLGYSAVTCRDGMDAVKYYSQHHNEIDALIIDNVMPHWSGLECVHRIREINPKARILISSGYNLVSDTQQIITSGISGFIQKPFQVNELGRALAEILGK